MKKQLGLLIISASIIIISCGNSDKNKPSQEKESTTANAPINFNAEAAAAPGTIISELSFIEKNGKNEKAGVEVTKLFDDATKLVVTVFKKANEEVYELTSYTVNKSAAKGLKADLTPMNDGSDSYTTYNPKNFGALSLVFVVEGEVKEPKIISVKSCRIFMNEKIEETTKDNGFNIPLKDFKTAEEWVAKLKNSFKK
ncbi:MAG: hypothetical protein RL115_657 [Bacteroidota bacterium]|jgi:hypothetical protein